MSHGIITLLTDFGLEDPYVGVMKGVILGLNSGAAIVDMTHHIKRGDISQAAHVLWQSFSFFPKGAIHVAVVDPGVGTSRRPITVKSGGRFFVGPDNGLFWPFITADPDALIIHLTNEKFFLAKVSHTFHGRDIFSPVAAHLSMGIDPLEMGHPVENPVSIPDDRPTREGDTLLGRITGIDHFGNVTTNIHREDLAPFMGSGQMVIRVNEDRFKGVRKTYADGANGELFALFGSNDHLEIAVNSDRADRLLNIDESQSLPDVTVVWIEP